MSTDTAICGAHVCQCHKEDGTFGGACRMAKRARPRSRGQSAACHFSARLYEGRANRGGTKSDQKARKRKREKPQTRSSPILSPRPGALPMAIEQQWKK